MDTSAVELEITGTAAIVTMQRAQRRNALSREMMEAVTEAVMAAAKREEVRAVIIAAHGPAFSAGHDLRELLACGTAELECVFAACVALMNAVREARVPVIAEVAGVATAAGCQLVAACDLAIAARESWFATPGVRIGLFCSTPMVPLVRSVGRKRAMEMLLTGDPVSAERALSWGLVNRVVDAGDLRAESLRWAAKIAEASSSVVALGKAAFYEQVDLDEASAYARMAQTMVRNAQHPDAREGMTAFVDKRAPVWSTGSRA